MRRLRFAPSLILGLSLAVAAPARAEEGEKPAEKEKAEGKAPEKGAAEGGGAVEMRYPPFSTRFKVLTTGLLITGAAWGISYAAARGWPERTCVIGVTGAVTPGSFGTANPIPCSSGPPGSNQLGIPIVGPWIALGKSGCPTDEPGCSVAKPVVRGIAYVIDGVVQLAGLGLIVEALVMKTESFGGSDGKKSSALSFRYRGVELTPVPVVAPGASGLGIVGTF